MFNSIYSASVTPVQLLLTSIAALCSGILYSWLISFRIRANRRFFTVTSVLPLVVGLVLTFINGNIGAGIAFGGCGSARQRRRYPRRGGRRSPAGIRDGRHERPESHSRPLHSRRRLRLQFPYGRHPGQPLCSSRQPGSEGENP